jgi:hypothetical protein
MTEFSGASAPPPRARESSVPSSLSASPGHP